MSDEKQNNDYVIAAMQMIIDWEATRDMCLHRTNCDGCPCYKGQICSKKSTEQVLKEAAEIFQDFLEK